MISPQFCPLWNAAVKNFIAVLMARVSLSAGAVMGTKTATTAVTRAIVRASREHVTLKPSSLAKTQVSARVPPNRNSVTFYHCSPPESLF